MSAITPIVDDQEMLRAYAETIKLKDAEIERLKGLLARAADALITMHLYDGTIQPHPGCHWCKLLAELRKAAE